MGMQAQIPPLKVKVALFEPLARSPAQAEPGAVVDQDAGLPNTPPAELE